MLWKTPTPLLRIRYFVAPGARGSPISKFRLGSGRIFVGSGWSHGVYSVSVRN